MPGVTVGAAVKVAVTAAVLLTEHELPEQEPPQAVKLYPAAGVAVSVTVPEAEESVQVPVVPVVQLITESDEVTVPWPVIEETVIVYVLLPVSAL